MDWRAISWGPAVTAALAIYGAALSTYTVIARKIESRRTVKVTMSLGIPIYGSQIGEDILLVTALNSGNRAVRLASASIRLPSRRQIILMETAAPLPHDLPEGDNFKAWIVLKKLRELLREERLTGNVRLVLRPRDYVTKLVSGPLACELPLYGNPVAIHTTIPGPSLLAQASDVSDSAFA